MKKWKRLFCGCLASMLAAFSVPMAASAAVYGKPDIGRDTSLEIHYHQGALDFSGVRFRVYRVADMTDTVRFDFTDAFESYPAYFPDRMTASDWVRLADTLAGYVDKDGLEADYEEKTDARGRIELDSLGAGLYLVIGDSHEREYTSEENSDIVTHHMYYHPAPLLVATPSLEQGEWDYDVEISPKFSVSETETISKRVLIVWDDMGYESMRPDTLVCELLRNEELYDTVELNAGNLWRHQWDNLDNSYSWRVIGYGANGYRVTMSQEGITTVVTNWYRDSEPDPDGPVLPTPPVTDVPDENPPLAEPEKPSKPAGTLPQTGQLWWPVPVLALCGGLLTAAGVVILRKQQED